MRDYLEPEDTGQFVNWMGTSVEKWSSAKGTLFSHTHFGDGLLVSVRTPGRIPEHFCVNIEFSTVGLKGFPLNILTAKLPFTSVRMARDHEELWREFQEWTNQQRLAQELVELERLKK